LPLIQYYHSQNPETSQIPDSLHLAIMIPLMINQAL